MKITSATYAADKSGLVHLTFDDGTNFAIYLNPSFPRCYANDLLDEWLAEGNTISTP